MLKFSGYSYPIWDHLLITSSNFKKIKKNYFEKYRKWKNIFKSKFSIQYFIKLLIWAYYKKK